MARRFVFIACNGLFATDDLAFYGTQANHLPNDSKQKV
jgi:hypothetical protein